MTESVSVRTTFRIPGNWAHPGELLERIPDGCRLTPEFLVLPDGTEFEISPLPPDDQFPEIFVSSCRKRPREEELEVISKYSVNICLSGEGGSKEAALKMMRAGAAIVKTGAAGVFIDNCGLAHGGADWLSMTEDGSGEALSFAFVSLIVGESEIWTMGMHVLGLFDVVMKKPTDETEQERVIDIIRHMCSSDTPVGIGHVIADEFGPQYQTFEATPDTFEVDSPMHNPFGRLKLVSVRDIGLNN
jgi:hypothetical protein